MTETKNDYWKILHTWDFATIAFSGLLLILISVVLHVLHFELQNSRIEFNLFIIFAFLQFIMGWSQMGNRESRHIPGLHKVLRHLMAWFYDGSRHFCLRDTDYE